MRVFVARRPLLATPLPPACTFISRMRASLFPRNAVVARWLVGAGPTDDVEDEEEDVERLRGVMAAFYGRDRNGDDAEGEDDDGAAPCSTTQPQLISDPTNNSRHPNDNQVTHMCSFFTLGFRLWASGRICGRCLRRGAAGGRGAR